MKIQIFYTDSGIIKMMKPLKVVNKITVYIPFLSIFLFLILFVQRKLDIEHNIFLSFLSIWLIVISFFSVIISFFLYCFRRFKYKEKMSYIFTITILVEMLIIFIIYFNIFKITWYVYG